MSSQIMSVANVAGDDFWTYAGVVQNNTSLNIVGHFSSNGGCDIGMRFKIGTAIPIGSVINGCIFRQVGFATDSATTFTARVKLQKVANAPTVTSGADLDSRTYCSDKPILSNISVTSGANYDVNLTTAFQELVNYTALAVNDYVLVTIEDQGSSTDVNRQFKSRDSGDFSKLIVNWGIQTSGNLALGGTSPLLQTSFLRYTSSGTLVLGGTSPSLQDSFLSYTPTGNLVLGGESLVISSDRQHTSEGGLILGGESLVISSDRQHTSEGGLILGGTSPAIEKLYVTGTGGLVLGGTSPAIEKLYVTGTGGLVLGGTSPAIERLRHTGTGGLVLGGTSPATKHLRHTGTGGLILGGTSPANPIGNVSYTSSGGLVLGGTSSAIVQLTFAGDIGLTVGSNIFDPTTTAFGWHIDVDFGWRVLAKFEIDLNFAWDVGLQALHYYQIEGECLQDITCDVGINPNDATCATGPGAAFGTIIAATDLSDLCNKMNERFLNYPIKWPIRKIRRSSRPVYTDVIDAEEASGASHDCNTLEDQIFCHIPECFDFCFEKPDDAELGVEILLQDKFYTYVASGELAFGGQTAASVDQGTDPDGGFELGGSATVIASHYNHQMSGNLILDGEFGVVSSAYSYSPSGELVLSGQATVISSAYNYRFRDGMAFYGSADTRVGINYKPLGFLEFSGVSTQVVNYIVGPTSGGLTLGGISPQKTDRYYFTSLGGLELGGVSANVASSAWQYTPDSGLELSGFYKLKRRHTMEGGFTLAGDSIGNQKLYHTMSGGVTLGGEALIPSSSGWSWQSQSGLTLGGTVDTNYQNLGDFEAEAGSDTDFTDLEPVYPAFSDNPARTIQPETGAILTNCGCNPMPLTLKFNHNLNEGFLLKEFLIRNKLTFSSNLTITFNKFDNIWRRTLHFKGTGIDAKESWIILFEWGCTDEIGSIELDQSTWKLSIWVSRFLKDSDLEKTETRMLYTFPVETVCINDTVDYRFNIDTSSGEVVDLPENFNLADSIFNDDIGLFTGRFWTRNPNLEIIVTELDFPVATPTKDIKPIFPA